MAPGSARAHTYMRVPTDGEGMQSPGSSAAAARSSNSIKSVVLLLVLGLMAAFYMAVSVKGATTSHQAGTHDYSLFGRYEKFKLTTENDQLKAKIKALQDQLAKDDAKKMAAAAAAAATPPRTHAEERPRVVSDPAMAAGATRATAAPALSSSSSSSGGGGGDVVTGGRAQYRLTRELIRSRCNEHNIILVTFVNSKRADYGYTWAGHVKRLNLTNYLVGAMDGEALNKLSARNIPTFDMESGLTTADYGWGTANFRQLGLRKTELIISLLRAGADPVLTDADALITRDPTPFIMRTQPEAQILVTSDHLMSTTGWTDEWSLEEPTRAVASAWNIGYMYLRHDTLNAMLHWQKECKDKPKLWDQNLFKDVLKIGGLRFRNQLPTELQSKKLFRGYNNTLAIGIFPVATFCSGHTYFVQRMPQKRKFEPYSVHTTFQYSGAVGKTHRLREAMLWHDEPEYHQPKRGLISYAPQIRRELIQPAGKMDTHSHFALVNHQLVQLRAAFLLAKRLNRILILPVIVCGLDRFWAPHNGTIPGSDTQLPIDPCPADHVVDLEALARKQRDKTVEGLLREYSFLDNPNTPASVKGSKKILPPPRDLSSSTMADLSAYDSSKVLHFERMPDLFASLPPVEAEEVIKNMRDWTSIWCCSQPLTPKSAGHIWYDLFWDVIPHTNRHMKVVDKPWVPSFGP